MKTYKILIIAIVFSTFGCEEVLETEFNTSTVTLLAPGDSISTISPVNFYWESVQGATRYRLQLVSPSFDSLQLLIADTPAVTNRLNLQLTPGRYQWRVEALNNGTTSIKSGSRSLIVK